jgi:hydrogenase/urease accessory protein HupE
MMKGRELILAFVLLLGLIVPAAAHEVRPALLQITETGEGRLDIVWKRPITGALALHIVPHISGGLTEGQPSGVTAAPDAAITVWRGVPGAMEGRTVSIDGLDRTITDALLSIRLKNGERISAVLRPASPSFTVGGGARGLPVLAYFGLGVGHILTGIDHLMFVLGLLLLLRGSWTLLKTVTAFTLAHSTTLALVVFGLIHPLAPLVEALVALSIVFVALELSRFYRGKDGLTIRYPWVIAFTFGLLHGTAFASGLMQIGLPADDIPLALLLFNLGIEAGQLLFIAAVLGLVWLIRRSPHPLPSWSRWIPPYAIGSFAVFWFIERLGSALSYALAS